VLDAVQGSALRSDPADAGPSDLDGVCAQLADQLLRAGLGLRADLLCTSAMLIRDDRALDDDFAWRYSAITSPMPHGIPFTSPDVKR